MSSLTSTLPSSNTKKTTVITDNLPSLVKTADVERSPLVLAFFPPFFRVAETVGGHFRSWNVETVQAGQRATDNPVRTNCIPTTNYPAGELPSPSPTASSSVSAACVPAASAFWKSRCGGWGFSKIEGVSWKSFWILTGCFGCLFFFFGT